MITEWLEGRVSAKHNPFERLSLLQGLLLIVHA